MKEQKELGRDDFRLIPNGLGVVEHRMDLIYQGVVQGELSLERWVETCSTTPARMFGLYPRKGTIAPGADADVVIYNPAAVTRISADTHHMNMDYSCFEGFEIAGAVETVLSRGRVVVDGGAYLGSPGDGVYMRRACRSTSCEPGRRRTGTTRNRTGQGAHMKRIHHWIGGSLTPGTGERRGAVYNPATGAVTAEVDFATTAEVDAAVASAREAFGFWREVPISRRSEILFRYRELVHRHRNDIARLLTAEHGKVLSDAAGEVSRGLRTSSSPAAWGSC